MLSQKINTKKAKIGIIGLGYVGLPLAEAFARKGFFVYGFDTSASRVEKLKNGEQYIVDVEAHSILSLIKEGKFLPTNDEKVLHESDVIIICVPTPLRKVKLPDISYVVSAAKTIQRNLRSGQLIILESTSYPTTAREVVLPRLLKTGLKVEKDFHLCFSPERVNPGDKKFPLTKIAKVVGGLSKESSSLAAALYGSIIENIHIVSSPEVAETAKLMENTFRMVNIALANEFALVCEKLGISIWEVIAAAKTKPFGFMAFYPGPGVGGHCLTGSQKIIVKDLQGRIVLKTFEELFNDFKAGGQDHRMLKGVDYIKPSGYEILSFDLRSNNSIFKPIDFLTRRNTKEPIFRVTTSDNRVVDFTGKHPVIVYKDDKFEFKWAQDLILGEAIPFITKSTEDQSVIPVIDLIEKIKVDEVLLNKLRVRISDCFWVSFKDQLLSSGLFRGKVHDYCRNNYLPLIDFLRLEKEGYLKINHSRLLLCSGRGPSFSSHSAVIEIDPDLARLIGYYLSEGCVTNDKSLRVRFTFNSAEKEYIDDVCSILNAKGIKWSVYKSKIHKSACIKVSSNVFGFLIDSVLKCGKNSYQMRIPDGLLSASTIIKRELIKGILRGDGGVDLIIGKRDYIKNGKKYCHNSKRGNVNYYSCSDVLFQQVVYLLQSMGFVLSFKPGINTLRITGYEQLKKFDNFFAGDKDERIKKYLKNHLKQVSNKSFKKYDNYAVSWVKSIKTTASEEVYSVEVRDTNTFVTSYGVITHNCLPCDPIYLSWKAKKMGFKTKMIDMASEINHYMPKYVVERTKNIVGKLEGKKILVLGVTYKKDVLDVRESPAVDIIEEFKRSKARVDYYDPLAAYLKIADLDMTRIELSAANLKKYDCAVIVTDHSAIDYEFLRKNSRRVFDTRNVYQDGTENVYKL